MSEQNKAHVGRATEEIWNQHNPDALDEFAAPDYVEDARLPRPARAAGMFRRWRAVLHPSKFVVRAISGRCPQSTVFSSSLRAGLA